VFRPQAAADRRAGPPAHRRGVGGRARRLLRERLAELGSATFAELTADCGSPLEVVARFLACLELYRERSVELDQPEPSAN
jgi:chromatin segregation and condensation protein Rec8/ScpA/Scc1 (kleisin family)